MKFLIGIVSVILMLAIISGGCTDSKSPTEVTPASKSGSASLQGQAATSGTGITPSSVVFPQSVVLNGFTVTYNGRTLANNQTTFSYTVSGPAVQMGFRLELPSCAPALVSWNPTNGKQNSTDANINPGIEWNPSVGSGTTNTFTFTVTYPGTVREGIILTSVKSNSTTGVGFITGACARVFDISGSVFTDGNSNGLRDGAETGILGAVVNLCDPFGVPIESKGVDANGNYIFEQYPAGNYIVKVDTTTIAGTSTKYLAATTATSFNVTIGPNSTGNNFGFAPLSNKLVNDLKFGTLPTNGLTSGFWKKQLQSALSGSGSPTVSKESLLVYIAQIRTLLLTEPYQLGTGDGLQAAFDILNKPVKTDLDALNQQLLALEFNQVSGHGIVSTDPSLQLTLIGWGEALVAGASAANVKGTITPSVAASSTTSATSVYSGINKSSGGGGGF